MTYALIEMRSSVGAIADGLGWTRCKHVPVRSAMTTRPPRTAEVSKLQEQISTGHRRSSPARRQRRYSAACSQSVLSVAKKIAKSTNIVNLEACP
ncbi:hypothetical protein [Halopseudomonas pelagia]|uniref:hypothetical protein n=1 Tax=Halopseudomonas pelagia TaxID=553151 RepID=UPI0030DC135D|tara:strand:- start:16035 stop:16319 length:285 start_codon:yes stop_codon:yes gene_type:complete